MAQPVHQDKWVHLDQADPSEMLDNQEKQDRQVPMDYKETEEQVELLDNVVKQDQVENLE